MNVDLCPIEQEGRPKQSALLSDEEARLTRPCPSDCNTGGRVAVKRLIIIDHEPFGIGIDLRVDPPLPGHSLDREFSSYTEARRYAEFLAERHQWLLVDRAAEPIE